MKQCECQIRMNIGCHSYINKIIIRQYLRKIEYTEAYYVIYLQPFTNKRNNDDSNAFKFCSQNLQQCEGFYKRALNFK